MHDETIYVQYGRVVAGICWRILGHQADAEDAVQETFLQALQLAKREPIRNWPGLLRRLATTCALARLRKRRPSSGDVADCQSRDASPVEAAERRELEDRLRTAIANLPPREAEVFCLRYFENLTHDEIRRTLNVPYASVTTAIYRARRRLEAEFADILSEDSP